MRKDLDDLVANGLLCQHTEADEWLEPGNELVLVLPEGYVVSFLPFHTCVVSGRRRTISSAPCGIIIVRSSSTSTLIGCNRSVPLLRSTRAS